MEKNPRFTVIIPAKNRATYLFHTLRTCSMQEYENLEIIVSDDGSTDDTREVVESAGRRDGRVRYISPGLGVGMRDNFEFALNQVKPGYVIALGADDGLLPRGIQGMHDLLKETGKDLAAWPAPTFSYANSRTIDSQLVLFRKSGRKIIRSADFLKRQAEALDYLDDIESPMSYVKGVASTVLIDRVRSRSLDGRFYACPTPDGYSGIVLAGEVEDYAFSGEPFSIYGISPTSQGMNYQAGTSEATIISEAFFRAVSNAPMHARLASQPYSPLIALMTADYIFTASDLPGWPGRFPPIDFQHLLTRGLNELSHGLYAKERLVRELKILGSIADANGLTEFFRQKVKTTNRFLEKDRFAGNGISPNFFVLSGADIGVSNIVDAAYFAHFAHSMFSRPMIATAADAIRNSISYWLRSRVKGEAFPDESVWRKN